MSLADTPQPLPVADILAASETQMRVAGVDPAVVAEYAEDMKAGADFPAIKVFQDPEGQYWLADGFHRHGAAVKAGLTEIKAIVRQGTKRDATLAACAVNAKHGVRRTQADKRKAIITLLRDPEWSGWSNRKIAEQTATDHKTVAAVRKELTEGASGEIPTRPTPKPKGGEIPTGPSTAAKILSGLPNDILLAECNRRGWRVEVSS